MTDATEHRAAEVYQAWAEWLVRDVGAPWNVRYDTPPPREVLDRMPQLMFDQDNRRLDGDIIHHDVTVEDYADDLRLEWGLSA